MVEGSLKILEYPERLYKAVRERIWHTEPHREDTLRYLNTYPYEPENFYKLKAAGVFDENNPYDQSSQRAAVEESIPALARGSAYEPFNLHDRTGDPGSQYVSDQPNQQKMSADTTSTTVESSVYSEALTKLTTAYDLDEMGSILLALDAQDNFLSRSESVASRRVDDADSAENIGSVQKALVDYVEWKSGLPMSDVIEIASKTRLHAATSDPGASEVAQDQEIAIHERGTEQGSLPAPARKPLSREEQLKPLMDVTIECQAGLDGLHETIKNIGSQIVAARTSELDHMGSLLDLITTSKQRIDFLKNSMIRAISEIPETEADEPVYSNEFDDDEQMALIKRPIMYLDTAADLLGHPIPSCSGQETVEMVRSPWSNVMDYFEWKAGWSLQEMLETYAKLWPAEELRLSVPQSVPLG